MKKLLTRLIKDTGIYALEPFGVKLIGLILVPLYTAYLTPGEFGKFSYIFVVGGFILPLVSLGQPTTFWKFFSDSDEERKRRVVFWFLAIPFTSGIILTVVLGLPYLVLNSFSHYSILLVVYVASIAFSFTYKVGKTYLRAIRKTRIYLVCALGFSLLLALTNILFVAVLKMSYTGVVLTSVLLSVLFGGGTIFFLRNRISIRGGWELPRKMLVYGLPLMVGNLAALLLTMTDKFMIRWLAGNTELGLYSFAARFGLIMTAFVLNPLFFGWNPVRWEVYRRKDAQKIFSLISSFISLAMPVLALFFGGLGIIMAVLLSKDRAYLESLRVIPVLALAKALWGLYYFDLMGLLFRERTKLIPRLLISSGLLNIVLNFFMIRSMGFMGAALATLISYTFMRYLCFLMSQRVYPVERTPMKEVAMVLMASVIVCIPMVYDLGAHPVIWGLGLVAASAVIAVTGLSIGLVKPSNLRKLGSILYSLLRPSRRQGEFTDAG